MKRTLTVVAGIAAMAMAAVCTSSCRQASPPAANTATIAQPARTAATVAPTAAVDNNSSVQTPMAYVEDRHYRLVPRPSRVSDPKVISVEEFFWYGCPHCMRMEPLLAQWLPTLPADARFIRVPDNLGSANGLAHQRAFYVAQNLGIEAQIHLPLMTALVVQHQPLDTPQTLSNFMAAQAHIAPAAFTSEYSSFVVDGEARHATELSFAYAVTSVPTLVIGGRYAIDADLPGIAASGTDEADHFALMLKVATFLVDKVRGERAGAPH